MRGTKIVLCAVTAIALGAIAPVVWAGTTGWSYRDYSHGSYVPKSGTFGETISRGYYMSGVAFTLDSYNVAQIWDYNNGGNNPGTHCDGKKAYLTLDQTAVPNSWDLEIDADFVESNFPNPKIDVESDGIFGPDHEESEVVALGPVVSRTVYYMRTYWNDNRDGDAGDAGVIQAQFAMSDRPWWSRDYNNCTQSDVVQIENPYGKTKGSQ
jgi:hypothetical protein